MIATAARRPSRPGAVAALLVLVLVLLLPVAAQAQAKGKRLVCWTEHNGLRACGDSVPPQYSRQEQTVLDESGRVVRVIPAELTPEQRAAKARADQAAAEQKMAAEQQASYERALLSSYSQPQELAAMRDERLATLDATVRLNLKALQRDEASLADLRKRLPENGKSEDSKLLEQIASYDKTLSENRRQIAEMRSSRERVCQTFTRDIRRFQELKFGRVSYDSACPAADTELHGDDEAARLAAARQLFEGYTALDAAHQMALFDLYAFDALIHYAYQSATGKSETAELKRDEYRDELSAVWKTLKPGTAAAEFSELNYAAADPGGVRISGRRAPAAGQPGIKFYLVVRPNAAGQWRIVEQWSEAKL